MSLDESRVREIMECWGRGIDMRPVRRSEVVELCKAWLANHQPEGACEHGEAATGSLSAGEFAGLLVADLKNATSDVISSDQFDKGIRVGLAMSRNHIRERACEHNIEIVEPKKT